MRTFSTSLMVLLVVAALFFGNCFAFAQMLLAGPSHQPRHNCCPGPRPVSASCPQGMQHFVKAGDNGAQPSILPVVAELIEAPALIVLPNTPLIPPPPPPPAPPRLAS